MQELININHERIDELEAVFYEAAMDENSDVEFAECPVNHFFIPKLYIREILMPATKTIVSRIHKTTHPFSVIQGEVAVMIGDEWDIIEAHYDGITQAGTRRVLYIIEDTVWRTFHHLDFITGREGELSYEEKMKVVEKIDETILEQRVNSVLGLEFKLNKVQNSLT